MGCQASSQTNTSTDKKRVSLLRRTKRKFGTYYTLGKKVGYGAFAQVRTCYHKQTGEERVVKIMSKPYNPDDFRLEVLLLQTVGSGSCPNVVFFYDSFEDKRFYYSVMEYCRGGELSKHVADCTSVTEATLATWMKQVLDGVAYTHTHGIVHRDIKPQNLLFADETRALLKLVDFGLGFPMRKGELLDEPCGTPEFLSPEMILGRYGRKVDIWAVGILCYIFLFGCCPFMSPNDPELYRQIVEKEPSYTSTMDSSYYPSALAVSFCKMLLQKDSRQRPTAIEALQHPWILQGGITQAQTAATEIPTAIRRMARKETLALDQRLYRKGQVAETANEAISVDSNNEPFASLLNDNSEHSTHAPKDVASLFNKRQPRFGYMSNVFGNLSNKAEAGRPEERRNTMTSFAHKKTTTRVNVGQYEDMLESIGSLRNTDVFAPALSLLISNEEDENGFSMTKPEGINKKHSSGLNTKMKRNASKAKKPTDKTSRSDTVKFKEARDFFESQNVGTKKRPPGKHSTPDVTKNGNKLASSRRHERSGKTVEPLSRSIQSVEVLPESEILNY